MNIKIDMLADTIAMTRNLLDSEEKRNAGEQVLRWLVEAAFKTKEKGDKFYTEASNKADKYKGE